MRKDERIVLCPFRARHNRVRRAPSVRSRPSLGRPIRRRSALRHKDVREVDFDAPKHPVIVLSKDGSVRSCQVRRPRLGAGVNDVLPVRAREVEELLVEEEILLWAEGERSEEADDRVAAGGGEGRDEFERRCRDRRDRGGERGDARLRVARGFAVRDEPVRIALRPEDHLLMQG